MSCSFVRAQCVRGRRTTESKNATERTRKRERSSSRCSLNEVINVYRRVILWRGRKQEDETGFYFSLFSPSCRGCFPHSFPSSCLRRRIAERSQPVQDERQNSSVLSALHGAIEQRHDERRNSKLNQLLSHAVDVRSVVALRHRRLG